MMRLNKNSLSRVLGAQAPGRCARGVLIALLSMGALSASAFEDVKEIDAAGLLTAATKSLGSSNYATAIPYLKEYLERMQWSSETRVKALTQDVRMKLAKLMAYVEEPLSAVEYLEAYTKNLPLYKPRSAWLQLAVNYYEIAEYEASIDAVNIALTRPLPTGLKESKKEVKLETLSKEEMGGFTLRQLSRMENDAEEKGLDIDDSFSERAPDSEPDYTAEELVMLNMTLAESCTELERWDESVVAYRYVIDNATSEERRGFAIMQLVSALVSLERYDEVKILVMQLYRTDARYDIRVNLALMKAASALTEAKEFDSAMVLYRMILPREDLVAYQETVMNDIRRAAGLPEVVVTIETNEAGEAQTYFGFRNGNMEMSMNDGSGVALKHSEKPAGLQKSEDAAQMLVALPPYEDEVLYKAGRLYASSGRPWEAVDAFTVVFDRQPEEVLGQRAFSESLMVLLDPLAEFDTIDFQAKQFLATHNKGAGPRMVAYALTSSYQRQEHWEDIKSLMPVIEQFVYSDKAGVRRYDGELYFMQAIADMMLLKYVEAEAGFERVLEEYPNGRQKKTATYWHAVSQVFLKKHQEALDNFDLYLKKYPDGEQAPSAMFYSGICLFGLEEYDRAEERFTHVIDTWPGASVYSDARAMRGDLLAAKGGEYLDAAQKDYEVAIRRATAPRQDTYAVFQMIAMFDLESRYDEIVTAAEAYLERQGENANVAKAAYWIGKTKIEQGLMQEAVEIYLDIIVTYGDNIAQDGVDMIIAELVNVSRQMEDDELVALSASLTAAMDAAEGDTLSLRLRVLDATIEGTQLELGKVFIKELSDLEKAPPPVLSLICDASFDASDYSRAEEMLALFQTHYEESDYMRAAYKLRGFDLFQSGNDEEAIKVVAEAQALYGTDSDVVWAQLLKGRIELRQGEFEKAHKTFEDVLSVRDWRGAAYAEATFYLGKTEEQAGDVRTAFGWYQRVYFLYKGYNEGRWAADGYIASARCLQTLGLENDRRNTYRAMLFDKYVNTLPQAEEAKQVLGTEEVLEIGELMTAGVQTNLTVNIEAEGSVQ